MRSAFLGVSLLAAAGAFASAAGQQLDPRLFSSLQARNIGPAGMSGRITAIDVVEKDPTVIFVGTATGGVWKSENGGQTWVPVFDDEAALGIGAVAVFQADPRIVWVGTGEGNPRNSAGVGAGIYKSTDGGRSWSFVGLESSERIHRILLHPTNPDIAYAGVMGPAWSDGQERGLFRTTDGGASWERILFVNERTGIADAVMDPSDPDRIIAAMWEFRRWPWYFESGGPGSGLFLTEDGGDLWTRQAEAEGLPTGDLGRMGLAFARSSPRVVYALVEASESVLLRSGDGGRTWQTVNRDPGIARRPFYYADLFVDPQDQDLLYNLSSRMSRSEDGGRSFGESAQGVHSDFHALWIDPNDSRLMYVGTDGGIYVSRDRGSHWQMIDNLPVGQFYHVAVDMEIPFNVYGGMQDNGSWMGPSDVWEAGGIRNYHWKEVGFGDGFGTLPDPTDHASGYAMSQAGGLVRFDLRTGERKEIRPWAPDTVLLRFNWNAAIATDPFDPGALYFGSQFVHKTRTRGETWEIISPDLTTNDPEKQRQEESGGITRDATGAENHTTILTIAPSPVERELIWVGTDDGRVQLTRSGGGHWQEVGGRIRGVPRDTWIPHIEASNNLGGTAYVVMDDHRRGNWTPFVFRTENYGRDWENVVADKGIRGFVHTLEEDPLSPNLLFLGTEFGLYVSLDRGNSWFPWTHGIPRVPIRSMTIHPRDHDLVVGTHGRAIYILDDIRPLRAVAQNPALLERPVYLFDAPPAYLRPTAASDGYHFPADAMFRGEPRPAGALLTYWVGSAVEGDSAEIRILDEQGVEIRTLRGPAAAGMNRVAWDLREDAPDTVPLGAGGRGRGLQGPEVIPGRYAVRIVTPDGESEAGLDVLPDPRVEISLADRIRKRDAVRQGVDLLVTAQRIRERSGEVTGAVDRVLETLPGGQDTATDSLGILARRVKQGLEELDVSLRRMERYRREILGMGSTRDAPTEAERIALDRMDDEVESALIKINGLLVTRVAALRERARAEGLGDLPEFRVVIRERRR